MQLAAPLALSLLAASVQQADAPASARALLQGAGHGGSIAQVCGTVRFAGLSNPSSCAIGFRVTETALYGAVGGGARVDAYRSEVTVYGDRDCPEWPFLGDFALGGFEDLPSDLGRVPKVWSVALECVPPTSTSASEISAGPRPAAGAAFAPTASTTARVPLVRGARPSDVGVSFQPFRDLFDAAEDARAEDLGGAVASLAASSLGARGMTFRATVRIRHHDAGSGAPTHDRAVVLEGRMTEDGRFDVLRTRPVTPGAEGSVAVHATSFDGVILRNRQLDGEWGNAHRLTEDTPEWVSLHYLDRLGVVHAWLTDVFDLSMFRSARFVESEDAETGLVRVEQVFTDGEDRSFVGERYEIAALGSGVQPLRRSLLDAAGYAWVEDVYADPFEFRPGDWRPRRVESTRRLTSDPDGPRVVTTVTIEEATPLDPVGAERIPAPVDPESLWAYWEQY